MGIDEALRSKLEGIRGEPLIDKERSGLSVHNETSDSHALCKHPIVSVLMLAYKHEKYLQQAIDGVLAQETDFEYELIIAEDCSPDGTRKICFENQARHPDRIRVIWSERNVGASMNDERAHAACRGEFVAFCEGDDYWVNPFKLQRQVDLMRRHPAAGICLAGNDIYYEFNGYYSPFDPARAPEKEYYSGEEFCKLSMFSKGDKGFYLQNLHSSTFLLRKSTFEMAREKYEDAYRWKLFQGDATLLMTVASLSGVAFLPERCSVYRMNDGGLTRTIGARSLRDSNMIAVYLCIMFYGWSFDRAFGVFSDLFVNRWVKMALETDAPGQKALAEKIERNEDLRKAFNRWYSRKFLSAMAEGCLTRRRYKRLRPIYVLGAHVHKWWARRGL